MNSRTRLTAIYLILGLLAVLFLFPFYWVVTSSVKTRNAMSMLPPPFYPAEQVTRDFQISTEGRLFEADGFTWFLMAEAPPPEGSQENPPSGAYYLRMDGEAPSKLVQWMPDSQVRSIANPSAKAVAFLQVPVHSVEGAQQDIALVARMVRQIAEGQHFELLFALSAEKDFEILRDIVHEPRRRFHARWENYSETLKGPDSTIGQKSVGFLRYMGNSFFISTLAVIGQIFSSSLVAFGFARLRFKGREMLFILLLASLMIPYQVTLIPLFNIYKTLGWIDTFLPLIVHHFCAGAFNVFLLRQYMLTLPMALDESAAIDGCGALKTYFHIILPNCIPALIVVGLFTFVNTWQDVMGPLIYLDSPELRTVPLGLEYFRSAYVDNRHLMMTGATLAMLPVAILFLIFQRYIMSGIATTGIK